jgi:hypothetical protein
MLGFRLAARVASEESFRLLHCKTTCSTLPNGCAARRGSVSTCVDLLLDAGPSSTDRGFRLDIPAISVERPDDRRPCGLIAPSTVSGAFSAEILGLTDSGFGGTEVSGSRVGSICLMVSGTTGTGREGSEAFWDVKGCFAGVCSVAEMVSSSLDRWLEPPWVGCFLKFRSGVAPLAIAVLEWRKVGTFRASKALLSKKLLAARTETGFGVGLGGSGGNVGRSKGTTSGLGLGGGVGRVEKLKDPEVLGRP